MEQKSMLDLIEDAGGLVPDKTVAARLRLKRALVRSWARRGLLPALRVGAAFFFLMTDVNAFLESCRVEPEAPRPAAWLPDLGLFIRTMCCTGPELSATAAALRMAFETWAGPAAALPSRTFGRCLRAAGFTRARGAGGVRLWRGLALLPAAASGELATSATTVDQAAQVHK